MGSATEGHHVAVATASWRVDSAERVEAPPTPQIILSFDVEEHFRIEAAAGLDLTASLKAHYRERLESSTQWLLEQMDWLNIRATFFVVGELGLKHQSLIRAMSDAGHEVASHSWDHRRVHHHTPESFREDVRKSKEILEDITGQPVLGYRAPTFSIVRQNAWALDVLAELGMAYDSSIYPVRHDRYGVPGAPRAPFLAQGASRSILEIPPATFRLLGMNVPTGGGGYFRLLPLAMMHRTLRQVARHCSPAVAMLYFHPWEFDPEQDRLPLRRFNAFRTYVGITRSRARLLTLLERYPFVRAIDVARQLDEELSSLPSFNVAAGTEIATRSARTFASAALSIPCPDGGSAS
jgi:polysaccharide deacetylase family protein (PEP-CTERM system associated)